jgi:hypothetical protein
MHYKNLADGRESYRSESKKTENSGFAFEW